MARFGIKNKEATAAVIAQEAHLPPTEGVKDDSSEGVPRSASLTSEKANELEKNVSNGDDAYDASAPAYPGKARLSLIMLGVTLFVFLVALDQVIISTAIPKITDDFHSFSDIGWYGSAYLLTSTALQPLFGRLYASFPIKTIILLSLGIFELGSLICAVAQDSKTFIVGRAIAGSGMAGGCLIIISLIAPLETRPLLTSLVGAVYGIGASIGPLLGGVFTSKATWRWCFFVNLPIGGITAAVILFFLSVPKRPHEFSAIQRLKRIDWQGTVLALASIVCLLLVCQNGGVKQGWSWGSSRTVGLIVGCVAIAAVFAVDQVWMGERATLVPRICKQRTIAFGSVVNFCIGASYFSLLYFLPLYFQAVRGSSAIRSGVQNLPFIIAVILAVTVSGGLTNKYGWYMPWIFGGTAMLAIGAGTLYTFTPTTSTAQWAGLQFLAGLGPGVAFMQPFLASQCVLELRDLELGSAIVIFSQTLGGAVFVSVAQAIFQNRFVVGLRDVPGVNVDSVLAVGVSAFREVVPAELLPPVILKLQAALNDTWLISVALAGVAFFAAFGMERGHSVLDAQKAMMAALAQPQKEQTTKTED
ncbi:uncharacterized protein L969DRAFT_610396 [Mixia osmundae IAM 14324]|uniref:uncharacterized protein n=1 Tax=Mixia osmundae (strain CBS 9802 / IAM 14324 / JCM 22182 / KY 12970) TaxID=764103 RepID=UPI0004A54EF7|nr:uncharacterized protein L969DRAFT_610396 [Mixia osmundae IAM 14324]KEI37078.1 hypothetical protein L969DRAFT_610396 [Mixia osmundae IAM 14324]